MLHYRPSFPFVRHREKVFTGLKANGDSSPQHYTVNFFLTINHYIPIFTLCFHNERVSNKTYLTKLRLYSHIAVTLFLWKIKNFDLIIVLNVLKVKGSPKFDGNINVCTKFNRKYMW